ARGPSAGAGELLRLEGVSGGRVRDIDLAVARGEIVGIAGLVGAGRTELTRLVFGADARPTGRIVLDGRAVQPRSRREAIDAGIGLLTEDRDRLGLIGAMNVRENITLTHLKSLCRGPFILRARETDAARGHAARLRIRTPSLEAPPRALSG